jgi:hypothetical protein
VWKAGNGPLPQAASSKVLALNTKIAKVKQDQCGSPRGSQLGARRLTGCGKQAKGHGRKEHDADHLAWDSAKRRRAAPRITSVPGNAQACSGWIMGGREKRENLFKKTSWLIKRREVQPS